MKIKITYPIFAFLVVLLASSALSTGVVAQVPNASFATGDNFHFTGTSAGTSDRNDKMVLANDLDQSQIYRYEERWEANSET